MIPRIGDEQIVATSWERFVQDRPLSSAGVRDVVLDSWQRCRSEAVNPASRRAPGAEGAHMGLVRDRSRDLYEAARPVLETLRTVLLQSGTLIMLSDQDGTILDLHGETRARDAGEDINLAPGGCWMEEVIGTNAIGTAIATAQPVQIYASEHYCLDIKRWTCAAAPILDPLAKTLLGVVDVSGVKDTFHGHTLGLVIAAAKQIEAVLARRDTELHGRLLERSVDAFFRYPTDCVVLFDRRGRIVRTSCRIQAAREMHGVRLPFEIGSQVAAVDLTLSPVERQLKTPAWLKPEWLHPVRGEDGELGTLLVIPLAVPALRGSGGRREGEKAEADPFDDIVGSSEAILAAKARARRVARLDLPVLLLGETGAGKEIFARALHRSGPKPEAPFVALNCGALTRELLASELFGYAEGAFTGARRGGLPGKFEQADGGTLFLDEIGEMPLDMQPHLLRVLQDGVVVRLGDTRERRVAVRLIAATNRDLHGEVAAGRFREDLYHRLCVVSLQLPALHERPGDIETIIEHLNLQLADKYGCAPKTLDPAVRRALLAYRWPGNVRELRNVFEAMFALSDGNFIDASQLPPAIVRGVPEPARPAAAQAAPEGGRRLDEMARQAVLAAIANANGNMSLAARALGISRSTLYVKLAAIRAQSGAPGAGN
ncbi:MAG TPA: sigma-54-dependent Fis family transcriptional regulator [Rhodocyclaceae bacterium]|nr:sigma-54-dependent Fis family transcriptional regulator [Rhodocyclaceae bacterium]